MAKQFKGRGVGMQQKRSQDENPLVGDYQDPRDNVGKGKGVGVQTRLTRKA